MLKVFIEKVYFTHASESFGWQKTHLSIVASLNKTNTKKK